MNENRCIFSECLNPNIIADLQISISDSSDIQKNYHIHSNCFDKLRNPKVKEDDPRNHGSIPVKAKCFFCGKLLPIIGRHPFCFDIGTENTNKRFWAHADCFEEKFAIM